MMPGKGTMRSLRRPTSQGCWLTMTGREGSQGRGSFGEIRVAAELSLLWRDDGQVATSLAVRVTPSEFVSGDIKLAYRLPTPFMDSYRTVHF